MSECEDVQCQVSNTLSSFGFADERTSEIFPRMAWIVKRNHPLCDVDNTLTRAMFKLLPTNSKTLKLHMKHVAKKVGASIFRAVGEQFGLMSTGGRAEHSMPSRCSASLLSMVCAFNLFSQSPVGIRSTLLTPTMVHVERARQDYRLYAK